MLPKTAAESPRRMEGHGRIDMTGSGDCKPRMDASCLLFFRVGILRIPVAEVSSWAAAVYFHEGNSRDVSTDPDCLESDSRPKISKNVHRNPDMNFYPSPRPSPRPELTPDI